MVDKLKGIFGGDSDEGEAKAESQGETAQRPKVAQPSSADASGQLKGIFGGGEAGNDKDGGGEAGNDKDGDGKPDDFVQRYTTGNPNEGYTTEEARDRFQKVMKTASPEQIQMAAKKTVANLPEDQRKELSQMIQDRQQGKNMVQIDRTGNASTGGQSGAGGLDDVLGGLLGGSGGGGLGDILGGLLGGASSGGGSGMGDILGGLLGGGSDDPRPQNQPTSRSQSGAVEQQASGGGGIGDLLGGLLSGPQGKAIMGGIAAFALQAMQGGKDNK